MCIRDSGQTPAFAIKDLLQGLEEGSDVVYAKYCLLYTSSEHLGGFLIQLAESVLFIFFFGTAVDLLRGKCFVVLERMLARTSVGKKCASAVRHVDEIMKH